MSMPREWVRGGVQWSAGARAKWEPVLRAAQAAWSELELVSVSERLRDSALVHLAADEVARAGADSARAGLALTILEHAPDGSFRAAVHVQGLAAEWHRAWAESDHESIGRMLGFPDCCREFFARAWAGTSDRDITPAMGSVDGPWQANTMLRWLGVRLVPHLPCSATCEKTVANAEAYLAMGERLGIDVSPLETLLRLPVTHDALNGVVIVSTPRFRFMAGANRERFVTSRPAAAPEESHVGGHYDVLESQEPQTWTDNGFISMAAMDFAHGVVLASIPPDVRSAFDLGCGDGRLLNRLALRGSGAWHGIEVDRDRAYRGARRHPSVGLQFGRIQDVHLWRSAEVFLLMPGRLLEMTDGEAERVRAALKGLRLVVYAYGDWLTRHGGLEALSELAGLRLAGAVSSSPGAAAAEGVVR